MNMANESNSIYTLTGQITNMQKESVPGLIVRAYDKDPHTPDNLLGKEAVTESNGQYTIQFTEADFRIGGVE
jgi:hypothetical protein